MSSYPTIAGYCNYTSAADRTIHQIRKAIDTGLTHDDALVAAMGALESTLHDHAESSAPSSVRACDSAETAVLAAWTTDVRDAVEAERRSRWAGGPRIVTRSQMNERIDALRSAVRSLTAAELRRRLSELNEEIDAAMEAAYTLVESDPDAPVLQSLELVMLGKSRRIVRDELYTR
ncbi:MAG: hypothetical protein ACYDCI_00460 [Candidatus Limnocylindrales bacterium]